MLKKLGAVEERPRIGETLVPVLVKERANKILAVYLRGTHSFDELTNAVYAMACGIIKSMCKRSSNNKLSKKNRRIVKCKH